jgi:non-ribosomal peptide synthetase-like protein
MLTDIQKSTADPVVAEPCPDLGPDAGYGTEGRFAEVLAGVLGVEQVAADSNFFDDLDADSMVMARFCARVRKRDDLPTVSMKDVYRYPTIGSLASALGDPTVGAVTPTSISSSVKSAAAAPSVESSVAALAAPPAVPTSGTARYMLCGVLQALIALAYLYLTASILDWGFNWLSEPTDLAGMYPRAVVLGAGTLFTACVIPILAKWILVGRWKPHSIQVWSLAYVRFWCVKTLMRANPLVLLAGSPIYSAYLRVMGAKIGRGVAVYSPTTVCTDLLTIGEGSIVRKDSQVPGYHAVAGVIEIGPVTLGKDVIVGEQTVIDINTSIGDRARLGHSSSLHAGQRIPEGERWHGSPARLSEPTEAAHADVPPARCGRLRRLLYSLWQLVIPLGLYVPLILSAPVLLAKIPRLAPLLDSGPLLLTRWTYYRDVALISVLLSVGVVIVNFLFIMTIPRLLNLTIKPGRVYRLYGFHYWIQRTITRRTNSAFFMALVGDSSYVVHYLRCLGYDLASYEQTGSNFGSGVKHDNPYLSSVGPGTMVADGLSMINIDYSSTSFQVSQVSVGARSFLGNAIAYPAQTRAGDNCLLATKVTVPVEGPVREGIGLLGAPSFEIPRTVERDSRLEVTNPGDLRRRLRAKNRHNTVTIALFLAARWFPVFITVLLGETADLNASLGAIPLVLLSAASSLVGLVYLILLQRSVNRLQAVQPQGCSIYDRAFWRHERYWKVPGQEWMQAFNGTPFKTLIWRALGVRIGRRVFDDGITMPEKSLVTIGDDCTLNAGSNLQCHSQEDGAFKSDRIAVGNGVTLGVGSFVHYGVTIGDGAVLAPDTFVMKGEEIPPHARWIGNPSGADTGGSGTGRSDTGGSDTGGSDTGGSETAGSRPRTVVEWTGRGWTFPEVSLGDQVLGDPVLDGQVTRLRIERPGTLRLAAHGDGLRIELVPDPGGETTFDPSHPGKPMTVVRTDVDEARTRRAAAPYVAGLVLIGMIIAAAVIGMTNVVPTKPAGSDAPSATCTAATPDCALAPTLPQPQAASPTHAPAPRPAHATGLPAHRTPVPARKAVLPGPKAVGPAAQALSSTPQSDSSSSAVPPDPSTKQDGKAAKKAKEKNAT